MWTWNRLELQTLGSQPVVMCNKSEIPKEMMTPNLLGSHHFQIMYLPYCPMQLAQLAQLEFGHKLNLLDC